MALELNTPIVIEAKTEEVYDKVWMSHFRAMGLPGEGMQIIATIRPAKEVDGQLVCAPEDHNINICIDDLWKVATQEDLNLMYGLIQSCLAKKAAQDAEEAARIAEKKARYPEAFPE